jgi:DNA repair protein RecN (Recombination protein N)
VLTETSAALAALEEGGDALAETARRARAARETFVELARALGAGRARAALALAEAVMGELPPLRLDRARFAVELEPLPEDAWTADGAERVGFVVATNPGEAPGPLARIASGGELSRFMLALKVVLARVGSAPCLVFDEVDAGIGGATAEAVGERLGRLGRDVQVLVVTHAPQVAARADHHFRVAKAVRDGRAVVEVAGLGDGERREEIARMLAGARVTEAARAAADSLIRQPA